MDVWSPIILMAFLFAPTVPSDPNPQNLQDTELFFAKGTGTGARDRPVTSSLIDKVKLCRGVSAFRCS